LTCRECSHKKSRPYIHYQPYRLLCVTKYLLFRLVVVENVVAGHRVVSIKAYNVSTQLWHPTIIVTVSVSAFRSILQCEPATCHLLNCNTANTSLVSARAAFIGRSVKKMLVHFSLRDSRGQGGASRRGSRYLRDLGQK
jgi:hypothetical protein